MRLCLTLCATRLNLNLDRITLESVSDVEWPTEWTRATLSVCALSIIDGLTQTYGYEIGTQLAARGFGKIPGATLYPLLKRLEQDGLLHSQWAEGNGGPGRKNYSLTPQGLTYLHETRTRWRTFAERVSDITKEKE